MIEDNDVDRQLLVTAALTRALRLVVLALVVWLVGLLVILVLVLNR